MVSFDDGCSPEQVLAYAVSSKIHSRHPLAQAVIRSTEERHIAIPPHEQCEVLLGQGMRVHSDGRILLIGSRELLRQQNEGDPARAGLGTAPAQGVGDPAAARRRWQARWPGQPARHGAPGVARSA